MGVVEIDELSEEKLQFGQQCNKDENEECGIQRGEYYKSYKGLVGNVS